MSEQFLNFSLTQINRLFPFFILIDKDFIIKSFGADLANVFRIKEGQKLDNYFNLHAPDFDRHTFQQLNGRDYQLVKLADNAGDYPMMLLGELAYLEATGDLLFLGAPSNNAAGLQSSVKKNVETNANAKKKPLISNSDAQQYDNADKKKLTDDLALLNGETIKGIAITDKNGAIEWVSKEFERTTGFKLHEIIGLRPRDVVYGQKSTHIPSSYVDEMVKLKKPFSFDNIGYNRQKRSFWFRTTVQPILDADNEIKGRYYLFEDVTEIKTTEAEQKESQELWKFALEGAGDGVWSYNVEQDKLLVSYKFKELLGYDNQYVFEADQLRDSVYNEDDFRLHDAFATITDKNDPTFVYESWIKNRSGEYKFFKIRGKVLEWDNKDLPAVVIGTITDINEEKLKDIELKNSSNRLSTLIENFNSGVLLENEHRDIMLVNNMFCTVFSIPAPPAALIGLNCSNMAEQSKVLFKDPDLFVERVDTILKNKEIVTDEVLYMADGRILQRDYIPIFLEGKYAGHLWKYNDITASKLMEIKLRDSEARLSTLINSFKSGVMFEDSDRSVLFANNAFCNIISEKLHPDMLIGTKSTESIHTVKHIFKDPEGMVAYINRLVDEKEMVMDDIVEMKNGRLFKTDFIPVVVDNVESGYLWIYEDITQRVAIENKVKEQREYFHRILNELPADIMIISMDQKFEFVNKSAVANDELREWIIGKDMYDYCIRKNIGFEMADSRKELFNEAIAVNMPVRNIEQHIKPDGTVKYMLRFLYPFLDKDGDAEFVVGFGIDVTEQILYENKLIEQREYYNEILNEVPADIVILSLEHKYEFINKSVVKNEEMRKWLIGKDDYDYCAFKKIDKKLADVRRGMFNEALRTKKSVSIVDEISTTEGNIVYVLRVMYPSVNANGEVKFVIGYGIDITEQIKNKKIAELEQKKIRNLLDIISDGVFTSDANGNVILHNDSFARIMDVDVLRKEGEQSGFNFYDFLSEPDKIIVSQKIERLYTTGVSQSGVIHIVDNGDIEGEKYLDFTFTKGIENEDLTFVGRLSDITEIVNKEKSLKRVIEKEKELNNSKSQFIRITSHELRTPLSIINSNAEILELIHGSDSPAIAKLKPDVMVGRIIKEVKLMTDILNELMMISRIETGNMELSPDRLSVREFITGIQKDHYLPHIDGRLLKVEMDNDLIVNNIDRKLMKHAIVNLINNAFKYSANKESPVLRVMVEGNKLIFEVEDYGIGIPKEEQSKLFSAFFRASNAGYIQGTGLGLMVVDYVVKKHNGAISFRSEQDKGTTFDITLPIE